MTVSPNTQNSPVAENKPSDKEINFRQQEQALRAQYERQLEQERRARIEAERIAEEARRKAAPVIDDEDETDPEPYVDHKKLKKVQQKVKQEIKQETQSEIQKAIQQAKSEAAREAWLEANHDFDEILSHAEKLAVKSPTLANTILKMPDNFERQKLVYQTIKEMGLHKPPEEKKPSIQQTIDNNKRGQYYQPSNIATAPYQGAQADFSQTGQKAAYEKMKSLINNVRL